MARWFARGYAQKGTYAEAAHELEQIAIASGNQAFVAALNHAYQVSGYRGVLRQELEHMSRGERAYVSPLEEAYAYTFLDDKDRAFQCLRRAYEQRVGVLVFLKVLPLFDPLRSYPQFQDLVHRIGLPQ